MKGLQGGRPICRERGIERGGRLAQASSGSSVAYEEWFHVMMRLRIATMVTAALVMATAFLPTVSQVHAQNKPSTAARIPFYSHANGEKLNGRDDTQIAVFENDVPQGKRLVVQFISLSVSASITVVDNLPVEPVGANCFLSGRGIGVDAAGNPNLVRHLLPMTTSRRSVSGASETLTGGLQTTIYLEPGPHGVLCTAGTGAGRLSGLEIFVSGELVAQ